MALDRYYGRQTKHIIPLAESDRLAEQRLLPLPDALHVPLDQVYLLARARLLRTLSADANTRNGELQMRLSSQRERLRTYYRGLLEELDERMAKLEAKGEDVASLEMTRQALIRDEALRMDEINRQSVLRAEVRLVNVLHVKVPRLFISARLTVDPRRRLHFPASLTLTWDPLTGQFDAVPCPGCNSPTFQISASPRGAPACPACAGSARLF